LVPPKRSSWKPIKAEWRKWSNRPKPTVTGEKVSFHNKKVGQKNKVTKPLDFRR
jgi:hypothetical protein